MSYNETTWVRNMEQYAYSSFVRLDFIPLLPKALFMVNFANHVGVTNNVTSSGELAGVYQTDTLRQRVTTPEVKF